MTHLSLRRVILLIAGMLSISVAQVLRAQTITTFDPPNSTGTLASAINLQGQITGYYSDQSSTHGFIMKRDGSFITFDAFVGGTFPSNGFPLNINAAGQIVGYYELPLDTGSFLRQTDGSIVKVSPTLSPDTNSRHPRPYSLSERCSDGSIALAITDLGQILGTYAGPGGNCRAYLRQPNGTFTGFDVKSEFHSDNFIPTTNPMAINLFGQVAGEYLDTDDSGSELVRGFLRQPNGKIVRFDVPIPHRTHPRAINLFGQITGIFSAGHGFLREPNGNIVTFDPPGSSDTEAVAINDLGQVTGYYLGADGAYHGFLRNWNGTFATFDATNSRGTFPQSINLFGQITGYYFDGITYHGFLRSAH